MTTEYPTLTALMAGREPGSVKARRESWPVTTWVRVGRLDAHGLRVAIDSDGYYRSVIDHDGPWLLVSEDAPALDTLRLDIAARVLAAIHSTSLNELPAPLREEENGCWSGRHAYALAEADALIKEARK